jgi:hypothetical protein
MPDWKLYVDAGEAAGAPMTHGYRPAAYVAKLVSEDRELQFAGMANVRDIQELYAQGLIKALEHLATEAEAAALPEVAIICLGPGFWDRLQHTLSAEFSKRGKALRGNQHAIWRKLAILASLFGLQTPRAPAAPAETAKLVRVKADRVRHAQDALDLPQGFFEIREV